MKKLIFVLSLSVLSCSIMAQEEYTGVDVTVKLENTTGKYITYGSVRFYHGKTIYYGRHGEREEQDGGYTDVEFKDLESILNPTFKMKKMKNVRMIAVNYEINRQVFDLSGRYLGGVEFKTIEYEGNLLVKFGGTYENASATIYTE